MVLYRKNVPGWERAARVVLALIAIVAGVALGRSPGSILLVLGGLGVMATGFLGFCPACAMVGRKLEQRSRDG
jgi:Protein of unknown function (DUF2892)